MKVSVCLLFAFFLLSSANPWDQFILAPVSRIVEPQFVFNQQAGVRSPIVFPFALVAGNSLVIDWEREIGGFISVTTASVCNSSQIAISFSETTNYIDSGDDSNGGNSHDGPWLLPVQPESSITMPAAALRGGFRYSKISVSGDEICILTNVSLEFTASPLMSDLRAYRNHFFSSNDLLNRIWYAGAYTVQLSLAKFNQGRQWPPPPSRWNNSAVLGIGESVLVDGAKRDRLIWSGDMGISIPTLYASVGELQSALNSVASLFRCQNLSSGMFSMVGLPIGNFYNSDTYHLWTLIGTITLYTYTGKLTWVKELWPQFQLGLQLSLGQIGSRDLLVVRNTADWARSGQGGENIAANVLLHHALLGAAKIAADLNDPNASIRYSFLAGHILTAINSLLWDAAVGAYRDNPSSTLYPQDGNAWAVMFGVANSSQATAVSAFLATRWNEFGATTPEWGGDIATFPGSGEVWAHFAALEGTRAVKLIELEWGFMLNHPNSTQSTFWEGYTRQGQFAYHGSYMSNAHGWATGPTPALSFFVLGIRPLSSALFLVAPQPCGLTFARGALALDGGDAVVAVDWRVHSTGGGDDDRFTLTVDSTKAVAAEGQMAVPGMLGLRRLVAIHINGDLQWTADQGKTLRGTLVGEADSEIAADGYWNLRQVRPAKIVIDASYL